MSSNSEEVNPYELLGLSIEATEAEIKTAYRQRSLKVHPDRNRGNPDAARKFHELNQAHELLLDPLRRMALDAKMRLQQARQARYASFDAKRKGLVEELEERERAFKKAKLDKEAEQKERIRQNERIMEEGRILREEKEKQLRAKEVEREESEKKAKICEQSNGADEDEPPTLGSLDTTVRVKYSLSSHPTLTSPASLIPLLSPFGPLDSSSILISLRPSPPKKSKRGTAVVPFTQIGGAFAAVCASGRMESGMGDIEICWAGGKEPELIGWLKKMGKLGGTGTSNKDPKSGSDHVSAPSVASKSPPPTSDTPDVAPTPQPASTTYSTFPSTFPDLDATPAPSTTPSVPGLDYESLTLMRLRQAERTRLEKEIREAEEAEES